MMHAEYHVVYWEKMGGSVSLVKSPANFVEVIVREWSADFVLEYTIAVFVTIDNKQVCRKETVDGGLAEAVRRGIYIFEEEIRLHPVLSKTS
jgi:hypothetical protein